MNCREAQRHLFVESDGLLDANQRAGLDGHVVQCADCRRVRDYLSAAVETWRSENSRAILPDIEREWHAVRRRIRGGASTGVATSVRPRRGFLPWLALPVGAAAALAIALYIGPGDSTAPDRASSVPASQVARADSVEVPGNTSTMVYVDDKSGWLIVWASDVGAKQI